MANLMDYLDWRGDLTFSQAEFNEVDNLILSQLVYVDFEGILPVSAGTGRVGIQKASELFFRTHDERRIMNRFSLIKTAIYVLRKMARTKRFCDTGLLHYEKRISAGYQSQFTVLCAELDERTVYVSYSGTDDSIAGWRENFNMGFLEEIPGQKLALEYLNRIDLSQYDRIYVGGHSKGGNLAVYASVYCLPDIQRKIRMVYNNDGPGFSRQVVESREYQRMLPRIKTILPESSVIGMLFEHEEAYEVVKSANRGIWQHDAMSWEVLGKAFLYAEDVTEKSLMVDETLKIWLRQLDREEKRLLVENVFALLERAGIRTLDDFQHIGWKDIAATLKAANRLPERTQRLFARAVRLLWRAGSIASAKIEG